MPVEPHTARAGAVAPPRAPKLDLDEAGHGLSMAPDRAADRDVPVQNGRNILVRHVRGTDAVGLMTLYDSLDPDDRYRRFFNSYHPALDFFTDMATVGERGGARLVAVCCGPDPADDRIVGEAGYVVLPNGDGELGTVMAPQWRASLGPHLLDALMETAAAAGIPNLEADVLAVDGSMLEMLRRRGSVVMDHLGGRVVRLLIRTSGRWHAEDQLEPSPRRESSSDDVTAVGRS
jgi:hypothetical protein